MLWATPPGIREGKVETDLNLGVRVPWDGSLEACTSEGSRQDAREESRKTALSGGATCGGGPWSLRPVHSFGGDFEEPVICATVTGDDSQTAVDLREG